MLTSEQEAYRDWLWSDQSEEGLQDNLDLLSAYKQDKPIFATDEEKETMAVTNQLTRLQEVAAQVRQAEQAKCAEVLKSAAAMYLLQGDIHGVEVCQQLENLLLTPEMSQIQHLTQDA